MKRKFDDIFPGRIYNFDKIKFLDKYIDKKDIDIAKWKSLTTHQKKYYIDKGYLNFALNIDNFDEATQDIDMNEVVAKANFLYTPTIPPDLFPDRKLYTKLGKAIAASMLKNSHIRFDLPNRDQLIGAIALSYPYSDYYDYDRDFPPVGPNEEYVDEYPPLE